MIYSNCDKENSNFVKFFTDRKEELGIKKFMYSEYDFREEKHINMLKEADIVVTNGPFSLFREFIALLVEHDKKFLVVGSKNAITYKETFKLIKSNKLWLGYNNLKEFTQPDGTIAKFGNIGWFTNLEPRKRNEELILTETYNGNEDKYPKYDNYDAINVDKVKNIPNDYFGVMGVPITFLDKYNPDQFEIIGGYNYSRDYDGNTWSGKIDGKYVYKRILIRRNEELILTEKYYGNEDKYPKYDNFDAINVDKVKDIPMDYFGVMGVPNTFLDKYNPNQFEIIGITNSSKEVIGLNSTHGNQSSFINGKKNIC